MVNKVCSPRPCSSRDRLGAPCNGQACKSNPLPQRSDWPVYGGQVEGDHYSPLSQINREQCTQA